MMRRMAIWLAILLAAAPLAAPLAASARAEDVFTPAQREAIIAIVREALKRDPTILRDAVEAMQADEAATRQANAKAAIVARRGALVSPSDPVAGNPAGDVTLIEFFDVRCPYCKRLDPEVVRLLAADHGVRLVYKDLPILGAASMLGAKALLAAQRQGKYDELRETLMHQGTPTAESIHADAAKLGLDTDRLERDMQDPAIQARLDANLKLAHDLGISGTPAMVIGTNLVAGAVSLAELQSAIAAARHAD
jgi:protein-disulfide isomerase